MEYNHSSASANGEDETMGSQVYQYLGFCDESTRKKDEGS